MSSQEMSARERTCYTCHKTFYAPTDCPDCKEREVNNIKCKDCGVEFPTGVHVSYCKGKPQPILSVELTEEDRECLIEAILKKYFAPGDERCKTILRQAPPEEGEREDLITEAFDTFYKDVGTWHPVFENYPNQTERMLRVKYKKSVLALIAAYHDHVDEVK